MANSPGDYTGKQKQRLQAQHAEEQEQRASQMAMASASAEREKSREVVDYTKERPAAPAQDTGPVDLTGDASDDPTIEAIVAATREAEGEPSDDEPTDEEIEAAQAAVARQQVMQPSPHTVRKTSVLVRARYDLEQVTIGHGNNYDFEEGRQYRVPPNVANHLAERDLVDVLG